MRLYEQVRCYKNRVSMIRRELVWFARYLDGPKFRGEDSDGYPADYIYIHEVKSLIKTLREMLDGVHDDVKVGGTD